MTESLCLWQWSSILFHRVDMKKFGSTPGADAIKKFTASLGIPDLGVRSWEPLVTLKSGLLNF